VGLAVLGASDGTTLGAGEGTGDTTNPICSLPTALEPSLREENTRMPALGRKAICSSS
jgi:hypothetical protein